MRSEIAAALDLLEFEDEKPDPVKPAPIDRLLARFGLQRRSQI